MSIPTALKSFMVKMGLSSEMSLLISFVSSMVLISSSLPSVFLNRIES
jgi:hypothetical protein